MELCKKAIELPIPFITGIGHDEDKTLLQRVADMGLSTPTSIGVYLQEIVNSHKERLKIVANKDLEIENYKKLVQIEKQLLTNLVASQKKYLNLVLGILIILILAIVYLVLKSK
ncbi:exodeoxyribonuclease VII large subunit [Mariniflexile litorale]|uniref:exodeoxyribonuclease VII large subunit n=1 Tax=Mariniflexile litorale TaxID=3045158 RepID=UPI0034DB2F19